MNEDELEEEVEEEEPQEGLFSATCPACFADNAVMGYLGNRAHINCRYCGLWYSILLEADDECW